MDGGQTWGLKEVIVAMLSSSAFSSLVTIAAGWRLSTATRKKVTFESIKMQHAEAAEVERVVNERIKFVFDATADHVKRLTDEISSLRRQVETLTNELHEAREEISQMRAENSRPAHVPPADVADILNRDF